MARSHLTLAALATAAVPGLSVVAARPMNGPGSGDYDSAMISTSEGEDLVVRVPVSSSAESEDAAEVAALKALTVGVRDQLPFAAPDFRGRVRFGTTYATVSGFLPGTHITAEEVPFGDLVTSIGSAIAGIHQLPTSFIRDAGLPMRTCDESRADARRLIDEATATGAVPTALRDRWRQAVGVDEAWRFLPTVVNGALDTRSLLIEESSVRSVLGWSGLQVSDPAVDLRWAFGLRRDVADSLFAAYRAARPTPPDDYLMLRALLYSELQAAQWLMHGRAIKDASIVDDAMRMMDTLVDQVHRHAAAPLQPATGMILTAADVEAMLSEPTERPHAVDGRSTGLAPVEEFTPDS
jgi:aminoglycoside phosphotransferase (APT) family kinase protein